MWKHLSSLTLVAAMTFGLMAAPNSAFAHHECGSWQQEHIPSADIHKCILENDDIGPGGAAHHLHCTPRGYACCDNRSGTLEDCRWSVARDWSRIFAEHFRPNANHGRPEIRMPALDERFQLQSRQKR